MEPGDLLSLLFLLFASQVPDTKHTKIHWRASQSRPDRGYGTRWTTTETDGTERANSSVLEKAPSDHRACVCGLWSKEKIHSPRFRFISLRLVKKELA